VSVWKIVGLFFSKFVRFEVWVGSSVRFWHDIWCGDSSLKLCYPSLFSSTRYKDAWVVYNLSVQDGAAHWNVVFMRLVQDWEVEMVLSFYERLYSHPIRLAKRVSHFLRRVFGVLMLCRGCCFLCGQQP